MLVSAMTIKMHQVGSKSQLVLRRAFGVLCLGKGPTGGSSLVRTLRLHTGQGKLRQVRLEQRPMPVFSLTDDAILNKRREATPKIKSVCKSSMSELDSAKYWLSWIEFGSSIALFLVAIGVGYEFIANRLERPLRERIESAREAQIVQLKKEAAEANARAAEANLLATQLATDVAGRTLNEQQQTAITVACLKFAGRRARLGSFAGDPEAFALQTSKSSTTAGN